MGSSASAATITFNLTDEYSGGSQPSGDLVATFEDVVGGVLLTMDASALTGSEFVSDWVFNFTGVLDDLSVAWSTGAKAAVKKGVDQIFLDEDNEQIPPSTGYDIKFSFETSQGGRLGAGVGNFATSQYLFTSTSALSATMFNALAVGNNPFFSAAHVQGIGANGQLSGKVGDGDSSDNEEPTPVPEPSSAAAAFLGMAAIAFASRKFKN